MRVECETCGEHHTAEGDATALAELRAEGACACCGAPAAGAFCGPCADAPIAGEALPFERAWEPPARAALRVVPPGPVAVREALRRCHRRASRGGR